MNEDVILNRILDDAKEQSELLVSDTNKKITQYKKDLVDFDTELKQKALSEVEKYQNKCKEQNDSNLKFFKRRLELEAKNETIEELKQKAIQKIDNFNKVEMLSFLNNVIRNNAEENEILNYNLVGINDEDLVNLESIKSLKLTVKKNTEIERGLVLSTDVYDKSLSIRNLVEDLFEQKQTEIYDLLFS